MKLFEEKLNKILKDVRENISEAEYEHYFSDLEILGIIPFEITLGSKYMHILQEKYYEILEHGVINSYRSVDDATEKYKESYDNCYKFYMGKGFKIKFGEHRESIAYKAPKLNELESIVDILGKNSSKGINPNKGPKHETEEVVSKGLVLDDVTEKFLTTADELTPGGMYRELELCLYKLKNNQLVVQTNSKEIAKNIEQHYKTQMKSIIYSCFGKSMDYIVELK